MAPLTTTSLAEPPLVGRKHRPWAGAIACRHRGRACPAVDAVHVGGQFDGRRVALVWLLRNPKGDRRRAMTSRGVRCRDTLRGDRRAVSHQASSVSYDNDMASTNDDVRKPPDAGIIQARAGMDLDHAACYRDRLRDARFDGHFFTAEDDGHLPPPGLSGGRRGRRTRRSIPRRRRRRRRVRRLTVPARDST